MSQVITLAGERLFALKAQNNQQLDIDTFIFAYVPGQDSTAPIDRNEDLPPVNQRVHQQIVQQYGMLNDNAVVYSSVLDSLTGPFQFNWVGLYSAVNQTLVAIQHIPTVVKTVTEPGASGNILNRNFVIEYSGIAELTGITVDPATWQYDFNARLNGMDELTRQLAADMNGKDWFIGDGFKVVPRSTLNTFKVTAGAGYVSGLRVELAADHILTLSSYPQFVYVDAWFDGTSESVWKGHTAFTVTNTEMDDYIDVNGRNHYVFKLARITAADVVEDLRNVDGVGQKVEAVQAIVDTAGFTNQVKSCAEWGKVLADGGTFKIGFVGDSTFHGSNPYNVYVQSSENPPASFAKAIKLIYGVDVTVVNLAVPGSTLDQMMNGTDGSGSTFEQKVANGLLSDVDIIGCNHGINDSQKNTPLEKYRDNITKFASICRQYGKTPFWATASPNPPVELINEDISKRLQHYVDTARYTVNQLNIDYVDQFYFWSRTFETVRVIDVIPDGAHMTDAGYRQSGFNLAIPFISVTTLKKPGDAAGLTQTSYLDNGTLERKISKNGERTGFSLSFERTSELQGINFPVVLDYAPKAMSILGLQWPFAARCDVSINGVDTNQDLYQQKKFGDINSYQWDAENKIRMQFFAGLNLFSILFNMTNTGDGTGLAFSGVTIPEIEWTGFCRRDSNMLTPKQIQLFDTVIAKDISLTDAGDSFDLVDQFGSQVLKIYKDSGIFKCGLFVNNVETVTHNLSEFIIADGKYDIDISIEANFIRVKVAETGYEFAISAPLPSLHVATPWCLYRVQPWASI